MRSLKQQSPLNQVSIPQSSSTIKIPSKWPLTQQIDISNEPYDKYLQNLKNWRTLDQETIIFTIDYLHKYKYSGISQLKMIAGHVSEFHKAIIKENNKKDDPDRVQVNLQYFEKVISLKEKFRALQKKGCFEGEKKIKKKIQESKVLKKNFVNANVTIPMQLQEVQKQNFHKNLITQLYKSFITYYPESHTQPEINNKLVSFIIELYTSLKKRHFYLKQNEYFAREVEKLCTKMKKQKFRLNKQKMLSGEISIKDVVLSRINVFEDYEAKKKEEQNMRKILKQSQIKEFEENLANQEQNNGDQKKQENYQSESKSQFQKKQHKQVNNFFSEQKNKSKNEQKQKQLENEKKKETKWTQVQSQQSCNQINPQFSLSQIEEKY